MISTSAALAFLNAPAGDADLVAGIVARATATLQRALGYYLGTPADRVAIRDGSEYGKPPVCEIILIDDVIEPTDVAPIVLAYLDSDWEWQTIATNLWRRDGRRFYHRSGFPCGKRAIRFTYRSGYEVDDGPGELIDLVLRMAQARYTDAGAEGIQSETLSDYSYTLKDGSKLAEDWATTVAAYRRTLPV